MKEMNIENPKYIAWNGVNDCIKATIDGVEMSVPLDENNRHYAAIMEQVENGTLTIAEAE